MRKVLFLLVITFILILSFSAVCFADSVTDDNMINSFITWGMLGVFSTLAAITFMVVEFFKEVPIIKKLKTKYFVAIVAFILILVTSIRIGVFRGWDVILYALSAIIVTYTATGTSDFNYKTDKSKKEQQGP